MEMSGWTTSKCKMRAIVCLVVCLYLISPGQCQRLRGRLTSKTFTRNMDDIPAGASTLAFVFDVTGSMWDDLKQVIAGARKILDTTLSRQEKPLHDYVLIPFHDPAVGPITVTTNGDLFQRKLKDLYVQGGGDCPEMSLTAIREALEISLPGSFIYVFTDASAKDYDRLREVLRIIQRKQSQVVFVLTGDCNNRNHPGYKAYEKIAATSSGQVFIITKSDVSEVVKFIEVSVQAHKVVLLATDHSNSGDHTWEIPFDPELREVTLSISGPNRVLRLYNPSGRQVTERDGLETLLDLNTVLIVNIKNATTGKWRVFAQSSGEHSLRVTGLSTLDFQARFARKPTLTWSQADYQPLEGTDTYILLNASGLPPPGEFREMTLRDIEGITIGLMPLDPPPDPNQPYLYSARPIRTPQKDFYIYIHGVTDEGYDFVRATKNAILNIQPVAPSVYMKPTHPACFDYPAEIPCKVNSLLPFNVTWSRKIGNRWLTLDQRSHEDSTTVYYRIDEVTEDAEGIYECVAVNIKGRGQGQTFLDVEGNLYTAMEMSGWTTSKRKMRAIVCLVVCLYFISSGQCQRLRGRLTSRTFTRNMDDIPAGASTLAFVFDVTGSMWDDLKQVIAGARKILDTTLSRQEKPLHDYVLIPFHDPAVGPITVTTNGDLFQRKLKDLYVQGGGDCPEMSLTAIREALEISLPGSFIYVFTDASAKDYDRLREVLRIIQRKQSQVVFVLTGDCNNRNHPGYKAYEKIAATSSGQVFIITKSDVSEVVKFIEVSVQAHKVVLLATDHSNSGDHTWEIPFDPELREVTLSISGPNRVLRLYNPSGRQVTERDGLETLLDLETVLIVNIKNATTGKWRVFAQSSGEHSLRVTGLSTLDFQARFARKPTLIWSQADYQPLEGTDTYILLNASGLPPPGEFREMTLRDIEGITIGLMPLDPPPDPNQPYLYSARPIRTPQKDFYIYIHGVTDEGYDFVRATKNAILNIQPVAPSVYMKPTHPAYFDYPAEIPCKVNSLLPFNVTWSRKIGNRWLTLDQRSQHEDSTTVYYRIDEVTEDAEGIYECVAVNIKGRDHGQTFLDVEERPPTIRVDGNVTVEPGRHAILTCHISSKIIYNVAWSKLNGQPFDTSRVGMMRNFSLQIMRSIPEDEGGYKCTATNAGGSSEGSIHLIVQSLPRVIVRPQDPQKYVTNDTLHLRCNANGYPEPTITWLKGDEFVTETKRIKFRRGGTEIRFVKAQQEHEGVYTCQAINRAGSTIASGRLIYTEHPTAVIEEEHRLILEGLTTTFECRVTGVPSPRIIWLKHGIQLASGQRHSISEDGILTINNLVREDTGKYSCFAGNEVGQDSDDIYLQIGTLPVIMRPPPDTGIDIGLNGYLTCVAEGFPKPEIIWSRREDQGRGDSAGQVIGIYEVVIEHDDGRVYHELPSNNLVIRNMGLDDSGIYICTARNQFGTVFETAAVDVTGLVRPRITSIDNSPHVIVGSSISLPCQITSGNPSPTRSWERPGQEFSLSGRVYINDEGSAVISNARVSDAGEYVCVATNVAGEYSDLTDLDVWVPPTISTPVNGYTTIEGRSISLECNVTGNPEPNIQWTKSGIRGPLRYLPDYDVLSDGTLVISNPLLDHTGLYMCIAANQAGRSSVEADLVVYYKPRTKDGAIKEYIVVKGDSFTIDCPVTKSNPPPVFTWYFGDKEIIHSTGRYEMTDDGHLRIVSARVSDDGIYRCSATNTAGSVSHDMSLTVHVPPRILRSPTVMRGLEGEGVSIKCEATGIPLPTLQWRKNNAQISARGRISITNAGGYTSSSVLQIRTARLTDDGEFVCVATNVAGEDTSATLLDIQKRPTINPNQFDKDLTPSRGSHLSIPCVAYGDPTPTIRWFHNNRELSSDEFDVDIASNGTLTLYSVDSEDTGSYRCEAENYLDKVTWEARVTVYEPPEITNSDETTKLWVFEGEPAVMFCHAKAVPKPTIQWYKVEPASNMLLEDEVDHLSIKNNRDVLNITKSRISDTGNYLCAASNVEGTSNKYFQLDVYVLPSIPGGDEISVSRVVLGDDFTLECRAGGIPYPKIRWFKGLKEILAESEDVHIDNRGQTLTVLNSDLTHDGEYSCIADNIVGDARKLFDVTILVPATIEGDDMEHTVQVSRYLVLECRAAGIPKPDILWYKDGRAVTLGKSLLVPDGPAILDDGRYFEFSRIRVQDAGVYICLASNKAGRDSRTHTVKVQVPPEIAGDEIPANISVVKGDDITLNCYATGDPPPTIVWLRNGVAISNGGRYSISDDEVFLKISGTVESDRGQYTCQATNDAGVVTQNQYLDVLVPPEIGGPDSETITVQKGDTVSLDCIIIGNPTPLIRWEKDGRHLEESDRITITGDGQRLTIARVEEGDASGYTCYASNIISSDSKAFDLKVNVGPFVLPFKKEVYEVIEHEKVSITCAASGIPEPTITWFKGTQAISKSKFFKFREDGHQLVILKADVDVHDGNYTCVASNDVGYNDREVAVSVLIPPSIFGQEKVVNKIANEGNEVVMKCKVRSGKPEPTVHWFKGDRPISKSDSIWRYNDFDQTLSTVRARVDNTGDYWCLVSNTAGRARKNFTLDVQVKPFVEGDKVEDKNVILGNDATFTCKVSGIPWPELIWTKDGVTIPAGPDWLWKYRQTEEEDGVFRLMVYNSREQDKGSYQCIATNNAGQDEKKIDLDVYLPPTFDGNEILNITVLVGENAELFCDVNAFPVPTIWWYKDGRTVFPSEASRNDNDFVLAIHEAQLSDAGLYECSAINVAGNTSRLFRLNVHSTPKVFGPSVDEIIKVIGEQIDMICDIRGVPAPTLTWTRNGHPLEIDKTRMMYLSGNKIIRISNAQLSDTGQYECHGINEEGTAVKSFDVTIHEPARIIGNEHQFLDVNKDGNFQLECVAIGTPKPVIEWLKDGRPLVSSSRYKLSEDGRYLDVKDVRERDAGRYICNASNVEAYDQKPFTVNVRVPPTIDDDYENLWVIEGQNFNLTCSPRSNSPMEITWSYKGRPISSFPFARPSLQGKRLQLFNVQPEYGGAYECTATNPAGSVSKNIDLDVHTFPDIADSNVTDTYRVIKGEYQTLECDVSGNPTPDIQWLKDFYPIYFNPDGRTSQGNYEIQNNGQTFTLYDAQVYDEGTYKCRASNNAGFASKEYNMEILVPPEIYRDGLRKNIVAREKSYVRIQCAASGLPTPTIRWLKDGNDVISTNTVTVTNHFEDHHSFLTLNSITEDEAAIYSCVAENPAGRDLVDIEIVVNVPPKIRVSDKHTAMLVEVVAGDSLDLECEVIRGTPEPEIHWWKRSRKLMASDRLKILAKGRYLRIPQVKSDDYGVYTCIARNVEGGDSKNFNVKVLESPKFDGDNENNIVDVILGFSHFVTCDINAHPQPRLTWFKDNRPIESDDTIQVDHNGRVLLIKSARLLDEGTYTCVASNKAGRDEKSTTIRVLTPPSIHDSSNDNEVDVLLNEPTYLNCTVNGFPRPEINWFKNGIKIDFTDENFKTYDNGQILSIGRAQLQDSGRYDCHARNTAGRDRKDFVLTVQVSPSISGPEYEDLLLLEGRYYELDCFSTGIPTPENNWFKGDTAILNNQRYSLFNKGSTLSIFQADNRDNGILSCVATNVAGTAEKTFNISVLLSPKLVDSLKYKDLYVNQGRQVTLDCKSDTRPPPSVTWVRNGQEIRQGYAQQLEYGRIQITAGGFQLVINDAKPGDAAQYSCELSNDAGVDSRKFNLIVNTPPAISGPKSETVAKPVDSTLSLDCIVQGYPTPRVSWYKDNVLMQFSERAYVLPGQNTLRIDRSLVSDAGVFTCVASNVAGVDSKNFTVDILVPPVIDSGNVPDNLDVILGDHFELSCPVVESNPAADVSWYKDGVPLTSSRVRMEDGGQTLVLPRAEITDAGEYTCVAKNEVGEDDRSFSVNILVPPVAGLHSVSNHVEVNETFDAILECDVTGGNPPPQITWMYNDNPIQLSRRMRLFADGRRLEISRSLVSDSGNYKCTASNPAGSVSDTVKLSVYIPPTFENGDFEDISLIEGDSLELDCAVDGVPIPKLAWTKSMFGEAAYPLFEGRVRFTQDLERASIDHTVVEDSGLYTCVASSIAGQVHKQFNVSVHVPPSINVPTDTDKITVVQGDSFTVDCPATGDPVPEIVWFKNGRPLPLLDVSRIRNNGQQLYIESAQLGDIGTYTCIAKSIAGQDSRNFDVDVFVPPNTIKNEVNITATSGSDVRMECHSDAIPPPSFSWYKDGRPLGHYGHLLLLKEVEVESSGSYTCEAENEAGKAVQRVNLSVYEKPTISSGPSEVIALLHETVKFNCIADGVPEPSITWWKDSKEITPESTSKYRLVGSSLEITDVLFNDIGEYMCLAANDAGSDVRRISLRVHEKPSIARGETNITVIANEPVTLPCEASGTPFPVVTWTKNSRTYSPNTKIGYRQSDGGSVHISAASVEDTGLYSCYANNDAGSTRRDIRLFVQVPPSIANTVTKYIVEPFTRLRIPCDVYGVPRPKVKWMRDGYNADQIIGVYFNPRDNSLDIPSVGTLHEAVYTCTASNDAGTTSYNAEVKVQTVPTIINPKQTVSALEGTTVVLPCDATGTPDPVVYWRRGPQLLDMNRGRYSLEPDNGLRIGLTEVSDTATYTCVAQNVAGTAFGQIQLNVHVFPQILTDMEPSMTAIAGQPFTFTIGTSGIPHPSVEWLKNGYPLDLTPDDSRFVLQESGSLNIPIVVPSDQGLFNVTAGNVAGTSWLATQLSVMIPPKIQSILSNITVVQGGQIPLDVVADGRPKPTVTWTKDGEPLNTDSDRFRVLPYGSVIIDNAMSTDAGHYVATAINSAGRDSIEFLVIVQVPPTFTNVPGSKKITSGDDLELLCSATGLPVPTISWKVNGLVVPGLEPIVNGPGSSRVIIKNMRGEDAGSYTCEAFNPAGKIFSLASIVVDSPPVFVDEHLTHVVGKLGETSRIDCPVSANPIPTIIWTKNNQRIRLGGRFTQLSNGSLLIHTAIEEDAGDYKCTASNDAGSVERVTKLILQNAPTFLTTPSDITAFAGASVLFNCTAAGEPQPTIEWRRSSASLPVDGRFNILRNYSLQVAATQLEDTGEYACIATNYLGSKLAKAFLTVQVNGQFGDWKQWGACSVTCGRGTQTRIRYCNSPPPANGGSNCRGPREDTKPCHQGNCPVHGKWSDWGAWEECSVTCGQGHEMRTRECNNPPSQYGGLPCSGDASEKRLCSRSVCPIHGKWGPWGVWQPCSETCGEGVQLRARACNNPAPALGGDACRGSDTSSRICNLKHCPVAGNWGRWGPFGICSVSCGGGTRDRIRTCTDPPPSYGGELCPGSNIQIDNCNPEPCPLNGNWADWGTWTTCSRTCGGGNRRRYRSCSQPRPRYGGRYCSGSDTMMQSCGLVPCPDDGQWSEWSDWTPCAVTCGTGTRTRRRTCSNPPPRYNGKQCEGDGTQTDQCVLQLCPGGPRKGVGTVFGNVNDIPLTGSEIESKAEPIGDNKIRITSIIKDVPRGLGPHLRNQVSILTPIYWTMAKEIDGAYNGYTLTGGNFERAVMVEFPSGEIVHMHHNAKGVDKDGKLIVDVQINGEVPMFPATIDLSLKDYIEDYLQTGPDSIYAFSDRFYTVNEEIMLYHWNHTIFYDPLHGVMPYLVEQLFATDIEAKYDPKTMELHYRVDVSIGKGDPSNECPYGFLLDETGQYCNDEDECITEQPCSDICQNLMGSYICECNEGFHIGSNGNTCEDIDECEENMATCEAPLQCHNTRGSYKCILSCGPGLRTTDNGLSCEDLDECSEDGERVCEHLCNNTYGSFRCHCRAGYQLADETTCEDIDECLRGACGGDITQCFNTPGSYYCTNSCPSGFYLDVVTDTCVDEDECVDEVLHHCQHKCENVDGSYRCVCHDGYTMQQTTGTCIDLDECGDGKGPCQYACRNIDGSYRCYCPPGYRLNANRHSCIDIDECLEGKANCFGSEMMCANTLGSFKCVSTRCPAYYTMKNGVCTRDCLDDECPSKFKSIIRYNSTFLRVGVPENQDLLELAVSYVKTLGELELHKNTRFRLLTPPYERAWRLFGLRVINEERGIIYTKMPITRQFVDWYRLRVSARSATIDGAVEYETIFSLFINVAPNPFA